MGTTWTWKWIAASRNNDEFLDGEDEEDASAMSSRGGRLLEGGTRSSATTTTARRRNNNNGSNNNDSLESGADAAVDFDPQLGLMTFQAQLAMAILESQRQMFENGGYGGNDRSDVHEGEGVTSEAKGKWKRYEWGDKDGKNEEEDLLVGGVGGMEEVGERMMVGGGGGGGVTTSTSTSLATSLEKENKEGMITRPSSSTTIQRVGSNGSNYGSVGTTPTEDEEDYDDENDTNNADAAADDEILSLEKPNVISSSKLEEGLLLCNATTKNSSNSNILDDPSCSICLCDYEKGETITRLPCGHLYHESCVDAWTTNHVRCPLCNCDLMEGFEQQQQPAGRHHQHNTTNVSGGGSSSGSAAATARRRSAARRAANRRISRAFAAMEDSIV